MRVVFWQLIDRFAEIFERRGGQGMAIFIAVKYFWEIEETSR